MAETVENKRSALRAEAQHLFPLPLSRSARQRTIVCAIAGFDPSSGAGVTADLMTFAAHDVFGCSAITALTVQSTVGVFGWEPVNAALVQETLERLDEDLPFAGVKIGMLGTAAIAGVVGAFLGRRRAAGRHASGSASRDAGRGASRVSSCGAGDVVVLDPVLRSSSGRPLFPEDGLSRLHDELLPQVDWITPNWDELALLSDVSVNDLAGAERAGRKLLERHPQLHVVATGGDQAQPVDLYLGPDGTVAHITGEHVETTSTHGTGCAFSSALLCACVLGAEPVAAVRHAKNFVTEALRAAPGVGGGRGPMGLLWPLRPGPERAW